MTNKKKMENTKKDIRTLLLGIILCLIIIFVGIFVSYAYFSITGQLLTETIKIENKYGSYGVVNLTGSKNLHISLSATDMAPSNKGTTYYATDDTNKKYETIAKSYEIIKATVVGGDDTASYGNCRFKLNINLSGNMKELIQEGDAKITFSGAFSGEFDLSSLNSPYEVKLSNLSGTNRTQTINAMVEFHNLDKDQSYLIDKTLNIELTNVDFVCRDPRLTLSFNGKGANEVLSQMKYVDEETVILPKPTKENMTFDNWNTEEDGTGIKYPAGVEINIEDLINERPVGLSNNNKKNKLDDLIQRYDSNGNKIAKLANNKELTLYAQWRNDSLYTDSAGVNIELSDNLIPVIVNKDGSVKKANLTEKWYDYDNKEWANAVMLHDNTQYNVGEIIPNSNIKAYFVYIPKYRYKLFDMGNYDSATVTYSLPSKVQTIEIEFNNDNTTDTDTSCATPMTSGASGNCEVGKWMTHPAFISMGTNGLWVAKFETTGSTNNMTSLPNEAPLWRDLNARDMFVNSYNYSRINDSHMMKNTEWGAVAYLSHSKYGINARMYVNNTYNITGCASDNRYERQINECKNAFGTKENNDYMQSTTGNISGIFDMSGGFGEYVVGHIKGCYTANGGNGFNESNIDEYDIKYFDRYDIDNTSDVYYSYNKRILGDATGELGPFYSRDGDKNSWYGEGYFIYCRTSWFVRGGTYQGNMYSTGSQFAAYSYFGSKNSGYTFRIVLSK